ncbi:MAG: FAD-dependent oxidoreductase, partial [Tolypothrix sp. T3-bin4]|nr:FAD-dependent oxidoreductase [Tolypothrix sp. T3-bin4]
RSLDVPGADGVTFQTNETIFRLDQLPEKLLVVGAGPIGIELSQAFGRLGCEVTVVGSGERILEKELPEISAILQQQLEEEKIIFKLNAKVTAFTDARTARIEYTNGQLESVGFDGGHSHADGFGISPSNYG